jgi:hypothetical protein
MSSDGTRKQTRAWETSNGTTGSSGQVVVIDDAPLISGAVEIVEDAPASVEGGRVRKSTLESFNEEMAVLDRPLETEVEYVDEVPRPSRLKRMRILVGVVAVMSFGGGVLLFRRPAVVQPVAQAAPPPAPVTAPAPVLAAHIPSPAPPPAAASVPAPPAADENEGSAPRGREKVATKRGHAKRVHASASKHAHHHASSRRQG